MLLVYGLKGGRSASWKVSMEVTVEIIHGKGDNGLPVKGQPPPFWSIDWFEDAHFPGQKGNTYCTVSHW